MCQWLNIWSSYATSPRGTAKGFELEVCARALDFLTCLLDMAPFCLAFFAFFGMMEDSLPQESQLGATIHAPFTKVSLFHTFVLDERSSEGLPHICHGQT